VKTRHPKPELSQQPVVNEPLPDWVPLWRAPFCCVWGSLQTETTWAVKLRDLVEFVISGSTLIPHRDDHIADLPDWKISCEPTRVYVDAMEMSTVITPYYVQMCSAPDEEGVIWSISGWSDKFLNSPRWNEIPPKDEVAARWHKALLRRLFTFLQADFVHAVQAGGAVLFARRNSVLSPFERVSPDQWHFFTLIKQEENVSRQAWFDPPSHNSTL
jgi:hypothetical protein